MSRKPQRGVCGICGCAVEAPSGQEKLIALDRRRASTAWSNGHEFDERGNLIQVRCWQHDGKGFPAILEDGTVQM